MNMFDAFMSKGDTSHKKRTTFIPCHSVRETVDTWEKYNVGLSKDIHHTCQFKKVPSFEKLKIVESNEMYDQLHQSQQNKYNTKATYVQYLKCKRQTSKARIEYVMTEI